MEKKEIKVEEKKSILTLDNRRRMTLNGVVDVISFSDEIIAMDTSLGSLTIKGEALKMNKLDVQNGDMIVTGMINSFFYSGTKAKKDKEGIISRLFK